MRSIPFARTHTSTSTSTRIAHIRESSFASFTVTNHRRTYPSLSSPSSSSSTRTRDRYAPIRARDEDDERDDERDATTTTRETRETRRDDRRGRDRRDRRRRDRRRRRRDDPRVGPIRPTLCVRLHAESIPPSSSHRDDDGLATTRRRRLMERWTHLNNLRARHGEHPVVKLVVTIDRSMATERRDRRSRGSGGLAFES